MAGSSTFVASSGEGYEQLMGRWSRTLAEPVLDFAGCDDGEAILDAGCGTGSLTGALRHRTKSSRISAIDLSDAYVEYAKQHHTDPRLEFMVGDICALPYDDHAFDRVL